MQQNNFHMKTYAIAFFVVLALGSCASNPFGARVREPFAGSAYQSNNRFFRGTGKGESSADNIARSKADVEAKAILAGQMNTTMKQVADQYLGQTQKDQAADVADKFQSLVREVMNTNIADLRKIGEQKYFDKKQSKYTVFIAYEVKTSAMFKYLKQQAKSNQAISAAQRENIQKILDEELSKLGDDN